MADAGCATGHNWMMLAGIGGGAACILSSMVYTFFHRQDERRTGELLDSEISEKVKAQKRMQLTEQRLRSIISTTTEGFWMVDHTTGLTLDVNEALCKMLGYERHEIIGRRPDDFVAPNSQQTVVEQIGLINTTAHRSYELTLKMKTGEHLHARFNASALSDGASAGKSTISFAFVTDMSERKRHEDELYFLAHYDSMTGLPNRRILTRHIQGLIDAGEKFALLLLNLDHFALYNTTIGHSFGDSILKAISFRLSEIEKDSGGLLCRLDGDDFVIVSRQDREQVKTLADRCLSVLSSLTTIDNVDLHVSASIGAVLYPDDGEEPIHLLRNADMAMFEAKAQGRARMCFYNAQMGKNSRKRLILASKLRKALERDEFFLHYQPQVVPGTGEVFGFEAMLRWQPLGESVVPPDEFIPILEETGLIVEVGKWVLETACRDASAWHGAGHRIRISVNLSVRQFKEPDLALTVGRILTEAQLDPTFLCLELTESLLVHNMEQVSQQMKSLTSLGVSFSIDDFGTGYSSLSYLQRLPIKEVKIDRAFVMNLPGNTGDAVIVKTIVAMANSLDLETVAEGVETKEQAEILSDLGVDFAQGFLYGRPIGREVIDSLVSSNGRVQEREKSIV